MTTSSRFGKTASDIAQEKARERGHAHDWPTPSYGHPDYWRPKHIITTAFGPFELTPQGRSMFVEVEQDEPMTINRVAFRGSWHIYRHSDGKWYGLQEGESYGNNPYLIRCDRYENVSRSIQKRFETLILQEVETWAAAHPGEILKAERRSLFEYAREKAESVDATQKEYQRKLAEYDEARKQWRAFCDNNDLERTR